MGKRFKQILLQGRYTNSQNKKRYSTSLVTGKIQIKTTMNVMYNMINTINTAVIYERKSQEFSSHGKNFFVFI